MVAGNVLEVDLGAGIVFVADGDGRTADVLKARVLHPQFFVVVGVDVNSLGDVAEAVVVQREAGLVLADGGFALPFEGGIEQGELPARRRFDGDDAVVTAI